MKKIIFVLVALMMLVSCSENNETVSEKKKYEVSDFIDLVIVAENFYEIIYVDRTTGVLYYNEDVKSGGYTPIYNADGTLKNIKQYE